MLRGTLCQCGCRIPLEEGRPSWTLYRRSCKRKVQLRQNAESDKRGPEWWRELRRRKKKQPIQLELLFD
jgi:hypothetical protein